MANSSIIGKAKNIIAREFIKDIDIIQAIGDENITSLDNAEKLINTRIFSYNQNPNTINTVGTFITIQVHIQNALTSNSTFVNPTIEIFIISHEQHMVVDNVKKITDNRNDYLSKLIDMKLNGRNDIGLGELKLISNVEGSLQRDYLYRRMVFKGVDLNNSLCVDE